MVEISIAIPAHEQLLLKDDMARDVLKIEDLKEEKKAWVSSNNELIKEIQERVNLYAKAIKAGCQTVRDFNEWSEGR